MDENKLEKNLYVASFSPVLPPRTLEGLHRSSPGEPGGIPGDKTHVSVGTPLRLKVSHSHAS